MRVMINHRIVARTLLATTGMLAAVSLAACTGSAAGSGSAVSVSRSQSATGAPSATTSVAAAPSAPYSAPVGSAQAAGTPTRTPAGNPPASVASHVTPGCTAGVLRLSFGGGDAGMSQQETVLRFTNVGGGACAMYGYPGVSYVAGPNGTQVGAPAQRAGSVRPRIVLGAGQVASTVIHSVDVGVFDPSVCRPTAVRGYRVYAPGDTAAMFIPLGGGVQGCAGGSLDPQLNVYSVQFGLGSPDQP